jgi:hypothetical protein
VGTIKGSDKKARPNFSPPTSASASNMMPPLGTTLKFFKECLCAVTSRGPGLTI